MPFAALFDHDPLIVLGIDPGTAVLGFGVVARTGGRFVEIDHGAFRTKARDRIEQRLFHLHSEICRLLDHHHPHVMSLEQAFVSENVQSAFRIGEARAMALLAAASRNIPVVSYPTAVAKKTVSGHGGASKALMQERVKEELKLASAPEPLDAADALGLALCLLLDPRLDPRFAHLRIASKAEE